MKKFVIVFVVWFAFMTEGIAAEKTVTIATLNWLPYSGRFLPNYGIVPELISAAYARKGYKADYNFMAWTKVLEEVREGKYDAAANAYYTDERAKAYLFSDVYMDSPIVFYKRKDSRIRWNGSLEELKPYRIGIVKGYANGPEFDKADFLDKRVSKNEILNIKKLILKQADLIVADKFVGHYLINEKLPEHEKDILEPLPIPLYVNKLHLIFSKKVPDAQQKLEVFNNGLKEIIKDGTLERILVKYGFEK